MIGRALDVLNEPSSLQFQELRSWRYRKMEGREFDAEVLDSAAPRTPPATVLRLLRLLLGRSWLPPNSRLGGTGGATGGVTGSATGSASWVERPLEFWDSWAWGVQRDNGSSSPKSVPSSERPVSRSSYSKAWTSAKPSAVDCTADMLLWQLEIRRLWQLRRLWQFRVITPSAMAIPGAATTATGTRLSLTTGHWAGPTRLRSSRPSGDNLHTRMRTGMIQPLQHRSGKAG